MNKITTKIMHPIIWVTCMVLIACSSPTEDERISAVNKRIGPDGHLTKTHLYINWPAQDIESLPPLKLKIPVEFLVPPYLEEGHFPDYPVGYFERGDVVPLLIHDHRIVMVYLQMSPGAKPYVPEFLKFAINSHEARLKGKAHTGYSVQISRDRGFSFEGSKRQLGMESIPLYKKEWWKVCNVM